MSRTWPLATVTVVALAGGCGSDDEEPVVSEKVTTEVTTTKSTTVETGQAAKDTFAKAAKDAAIVCGLVSREKFAADFGLKTTDPSALAARYARGYDASVRQQVEAACLKAILKRKQP